MSSSLRLSEKPRSEHCGKGKKPPMFASILSCYKLKLPKICRYDSQKEVSG